MGEVHLGRVPRQQQGALGTGANHLLGCWILASVLCRAARSNGVCLMQQRSPDTLQSSQRAGYDTPHSPAPPIPARCRRAGCQKGMWLHETHTCTGFHPHFASTPSLIVRLQLRGCRHRGRSAELVSISNRTYVVRDDRPTTVT